MKLPIYIVGSTNIGRFNKMSAERSYNCIISEITSSNPQRPVESSLVHYAGYKKIEKVSDDDKANLRGLFRSEIGEFMLVVANNELYRINKDLHSEFIGNVTNGKDLAEIVENGNGQILILIESDLFLYDYKDSSYSFEKVSLDFVPTSLAQSKGYIFASVYNSNVLRYTSVNDAKTWPNDNENEIGEDKIVCVRTLNDRILAFGSIGVKFYTDTGLSINPFRQDDSVISEHGVIGKNSVASGLGYAAWLAGSKEGGPSIRITTGGQSYAASSQGIDYELGQLEAPEDNVSFIFEEDGHIFYHITFIQDNITIVYDISTSSVFYATDENRDKYIAKALTRFNNKYYFIGFKDGFLYEASNDYTNYDGKIIPRIRVCSHRRLKTQSPVRFNYAQISMLQGASKINTKPKALMSISFDGGESFSSKIEGEITNHARRSAYLRWDNLGASDDIVFQFEFYTDGPLCVMNDSFCEVEDADISVAA